MTGWVDLHCHYLPAVDDGVRSQQEGAEVLIGLRALGFQRVIATPHIRSAMFDNRAEPLKAAFAEFVRTTTPESWPETGLAAEHYFDDVFWDLFCRGEALPYPGGKAALIEFHYEAWPRNIERLLFDMQLRGVRPVIAHPERYAELARRTDALDSLLDAGAFTLLDVMSLAGRYGERSRLAAERMLDEGAYDAACSDCHRPSDVLIVRQAIDALTRLVGAAERDRLLGEHPAAILQGRYDP